MAADFTYTFDGSFYRVMPENAQAEALYNLNASNGWHAVMFPIEFDRFKQDIRRTGWSLRKARPVSMRVDAKLLAELGI